MPVPREQIGNAPSGMIGDACDHRRRERQERSKPVAAALAAWADETMTSAASASISGLRAGRPDLAGQGRGLQIDALAREDLGVPVKRQVVIVLGDDDMGRGARCQRGRGRWHDRATVPR